MYGRAFSPGCSGLLEAFLFRSRCDEEPEASSQGRKGCEMLVNLVPPTGSRTQPPAIIKSCRVEYRTPRTMIRLTVRPDKVPTVLRKSNRTFPPHTLYRASTSRACRQQISRPYLPRFPPFFRASSQGSRPIAIAALSKGLKACSDYRPATPCPRVVDHLQRFGRDHARETIFGSTKLFTNIYTTHSNDPGNLGSSCRAISKPRPQTLVPARITRNEWPTRYVTV